MQSILVTGGAGYIGSHICKHLAEHGVTPVTLDNLAHGHEGLVRFGPLEMGDISDVDWVRTVIRRHQARAVIHCAAYTGATESLVQPAVYYCNNLIGTLSLLNGMVAEGVTQLVFASSSAVYGEPEHLPLRENDPIRPLTPYARSKWMMEQIIADYADAYGMRAVSLRCFDVAGADPTGETGEPHNPETYTLPLLLRAAATGRPFALYGNDYATLDGTMVRDYIHPSDLAEAHLLALRYLDEGGSSCVLNAGSGHGISMRELVEAVEKVSGTQITVDVKARRPGDVAELIADPARIRAMFNFVPAMSSLQTIVETAWHWHSLVARSRAQSA